MRIGLQNKICMNINYYDIIEKNIFNGCIKRNNKKKFCLNKNLQLTN